jgi:hypothetical protein
MKIELLTRGEDGHAIPGRVIDYDPADVVYTAAKAQAPQGTLTAVNCKFLWHGDSIRFFVPTDLMTEVARLDDEGEEYTEFIPSEEAIRLVTERMTARDGGNGGGK